MDIRSPQADTISDVKADQDSVIVDVNRFADALISADPKQLLEIAVEFEKKAEIFLKSPTTVDEKGAGLQYRYDAALAYTRAFHLERCKNAEEIALLYLDCYTFVAQWQAERPDLEKDFKELKIYISQLASQLFGTFTRYHLFHASIDGEVKEMKDFTQFTPGKALVAFKDFVKKQIPTKLH